MAWWPRGRVKAQPPAPAGVAEEPPGWRSHPPLQRVVGATSPVAATDGFTADLATWRNPSFLGPLAHSVDANGPAGSVDGLLDVAGSPVSVSASDQLPVRWGQPERRPVIQRLSIPAAREPVVGAAGVERNSAVSGHDEPGWQLDPMPAAGDLGSTTFVSASDVSLPSLELPVASLPASAPVVARSDSRQDQVGVLSTTGMSGQVAPLLPGAEVSGSSAKTDAAEPESSAEPERSAGPLVERLGARPPVQPTAQQAMQPAAQRTPDARVPPSLTIGVKSPEFAADDSVQRAVAMPVNPARRVPPDAFPAGAASRVAGRPGVGSTERAAEAPAPPLAVEVLSPVPDPSSGEAPVVSRSPDRSDRTDSTDSTEPVPAGSASDTASDTAGLLGASPLAERLVPEEHPPPDSLASVSTGALPRQLTPLVGSDSPLGVVDVQPAVTEQGAGAGAANQPSAHPEPRTPAGLRLGLGAPLDALPAVAQRLALDTGTDPSSPRSLKPTPTSTDSGLSGPELTLPASHPPASLPPANSGAGPAEADPPPLDVARLASPTDPIADEPEESVRSEPLLGSAGPLRSEVEPPSPKPALDMVSAAGDLPLAGLPAPAATSVQRSGPAQPTPPSLTAPLLGAGPRQNGHRSAQPLGRSDLTTWSHRDVGRPVQRLTSTGSAARDPAAMGPAAPEEYPLTVPTVDAIRHGTMSPPLPPPLPPVPTGSLDPLPVSRQVTADVGDAAAAPGRATGDPGLAAVAAGIATRDADGSYLFASATGAAPSTSRSVQRSAGSGTVAQRVEVPLDADSAQALTETRAPSAPGPTTTPGASAQGPAGASHTDIEELARRLFDPLSAHLKAELRLDRERAGLVTDLRR